MKLPFKSVGLSTIIHATESEKKLKEFLRKLVPEEVNIESSEAEGHYGDSKKILSIDIQRRPFLREFWDRVLERLDEEERNRLSNECIEKIGEDCRLYLRFDKQTAVSENKLKITDSGDVLHVRINLSAYPAKKKIAVKKMKEFINSEFEYE